MTQFKRSLSSVVIIMLTILICISISLWDVCRTILVTEHNLNKMDLGYTFFRLQHESNPISSDLESFKSLYKLLTDSDIYTYYELYEQPLDIPHHFGPFFDEASQNLTDMYGRVPSIQINQNVQKDFDFSVDSGRLFETHDFEYDGKSNIPVYMGHGYADIYHINDIFSAEYLFDTYNFYVIGFLDKGISINTSLCSLELDKYIVMPSFDVLHDAADTDSIKIHYANKTSGMMKAAPENVEKVKEYFTSLLENTDAGTYSWSCSSLSSSFEEIVGLGLWTCFYLTLILAFIFAAALVSILMVGAKKWDKTKFSRFPFLIKASISTVVVIISTTTFLIYPVATYLQMRVPVIKYIIISGAVSAVSLFLIPGIMKRFSGTKSIH